MKRHNPYDTKTSVNAWRRVCLFLGAALLLLCPGFTPGVNAQEEDFVVVCPIDGDILDGIAVVVKRAVTEEAQGAKAILFIIDTYGGRVDSAIDIANTIMEAPAPTIAFIKGRGAISAGALISYACDQIVMAPGANIGASTPVVPGMEMTEEMNEKSMSFLRAKYRALGEENGHNPLIGEAMVDPSIELYAADDPDGAFRIYKVEKGQVVESSLSGAPALSVGQTPPRGVTAQVAQTDSDETLRQIQEAVRSLTGAPAPPPQPAKPDASAEDTSSTVSPVPDPAAALTIKGLPENARLVSASGKLLTLTTDEALKLGLIKTVSNSPAEALNTLGFGAYRRIDITKTWAEVIFAFLTSPMISGLLLLCGIAGVYLEFKTPGFGIPGILGGIFLALFFGSRLVLGIADWLDVLLVLIGIGLLITEIFFLPGFGVAGAAGILCLMAGIYLALTRVTVPRYTWDFERLRDAGITVVLAATIFFAFLVLTWKYFPRSRLANRLILATAETAAAGYTVQTEQEARAALGLKGKAASMLRPAGRGRFGAVTYDVVTRGEFIEAGTPIEIIEAQGNRYVVRELEAGKEEV